MTLLHYDAYTYDDAPMPLGLFDSFVAVQGPVWDWHEGGGGTRTPAPAYIDVAQLNRTHSGATPITDALHERAVMQMFDAVVRDNVTCTFSSRPIGR